MDCAFFRTSTIAWNGKNESENKEKVDEDRNIINATEKEMDDSSNSNKEAINRYFEEQMAKSAKDELENYRLEREKATELSEEMHNPPVSLISIYILNVFSNSNDEVYSLFFCMPGHHN